MGRVKPGAVKDRGEAKEALDRVLTHAESHGEAYAGASDDHAAIRAAFFDDAEDREAAKADADADADDR
jgi:hypothetical protein